MRPKERVGPAMVILSEGVIMTDHPSLFLRRVAAIVVREMLVTARFSQRRLTTQRSV